MLAVQPGTLSGYASAWNSYTHFCSSKQLDPLSEPGMQQYIYHCFAAHDSFGKANSAYSALMHWAKVENLQLDFSPATLMGLRAFRRIYKRSRPVKWVTADDLNALLSLWSDVQLEYWVLVVLSFFTLVRPVEILFLEWSHVFLDKKYLWLPWSKNDPEGDGTYVTLLPQALDALSRHLSALARPPSPTDKVFSVPYASLNPWLASKCARAGIGPYTWYHFKHGGATHLALLGWSFARIKEHGRWKSERSARIYIHAPVHQ